MHKINKLIVNLMIATIIINGAITRAYADSKQSGRKGAHSELSLLTGKKPKFSSSDCLTCHGVKTEGIPYVNIDHLKASVHSELTCTDCHQGIHSLPHPEKLPPPNCGACHSDVESKYKNSIHGKATATGITAAAYCWSCHGMHDILSATNPSSTVYPQNLPTTCGKCHNSAEMAKQYNIPVANPYQLYEKSVHAQALKDGLPAATCSSCHGVHDILPPNITTSTIAKANVPKTCGQCHEEQYKNYIQSSHWKAFENGISNAPVCTDCHAEHAILAQNNPNSPIYPLNIPKTCTDCHGNITLSESLGLPAVSLSNYLSSFHGIMIKGGSVIAANCASCHRAHKVLGPSNPDSSVYPANLPHTCGKCHPGITKADIRHLKAIHGPVGIGNEVIKIVKTAYIWLITITILGMLIFVSADLVRKTIDREKKGEHRTAEEGEYIRFNKTEIVLHGLNFISFILLAYTGFAYHWPNEWWSSWITHIDNGLIRAWTHRISGVVLLVVFLIQAILMAFTERGREQFKELLPTLDDIRGTLQLFFYNIGLTDKRPAFARFTPFEKFEYWALVWGNTVMGITGLSLWFKTEILRFVPLWWLNLFLLIHFYEAILATLAIIFWHFYWVIFNPVLYPLNTSMCTGKLPIAVMEEEHPLELAKHESKKQTGTTSIETDQYK
ncbi:MAG: cytochrome c3 family protein [bacterium]